MWNVVPSLTLCVSRKFFGKVWIGKAFFGLLLGILCMYYGQISA